MRILSSCFILLVLGFAGIYLSQAEEKPKANLTDSAFQEEIVPILKRTCFECHSEDRLEAEIDLKSFVDLKGIRADIQTWLKVREMLKTGQMPPPKAPQPTDGERALLQNWVNEFLKGEAKARAGDPGPIVLRRLNNAEYTYAIHDLTRVESLNPTREFPVDGAAGEGFTNVGSGQGMSPALIQKYLDAGKEISRHAVLTPTGIRFSPTETRRDHTDELLDQIRAFYRKYSSDHGGTKVNLQGIEFETNQGGMLSLEPYLLASLEERERLKNGGETEFQEIAKTRKLNPKYLKTLFESLSGEQPSGFLIDAIRNRWRTAKLSEVPALRAEIEQLQAALWKFNSIGHIGREGGVKSWLEGVTPIVELLELKHQFPSPEGNRQQLPEMIDQPDVTLYLKVSQSGTERDSGKILLKNPRIEFKLGEQTTSLPLHDVRELSNRIEQGIEKELSRTAKYLDALVTVQSSKKSKSEVAKESGLNPHILDRWSEWTGIGKKLSREITGHFQDKIAKAQGYEAINGWGRAETPSLLTNQSDEAITFLTLTVPAKGVTVHPSPTLDAIVAWKSPIKGKIQLEGLVADADNKCGNGASWKVEVRRESGASVLASGVIDNGAEKLWKGENPIQVDEGDLVLLSIGPRNNDHSCDTTHVELLIQELGEEKRQWNLSEEIVENVLKGNPLPDSLGNPSVWHFCSSPIQSTENSTIPAETALGNWKQAVLESKTKKELDRLANEVQQVLTGPVLEPLSPPDESLNKGIRDWRGPMKWVTVPPESLPEPSTQGREKYGLESELFDSSNNLVLQTPKILEIRLPKALATGAEFVASSELMEESGALNVLLSTSKPEETLPRAPFLVRGDRAKIERAIQEFQNLFPPALCYVRIVPVDEVVTLTLYYREDEHLQRLMLNMEQVAELNRLWDELFYVAQEPLQLVVSFEQISEFATQDRPDLVKAFAPLREPINKRAEEFRKRMVKLEPVHLESVLELARKAWRRPLQESEREGLTNLYKKLRESEIPHEESIQLLLARVFASPAFLYKLEQPAEDSKASPIADLELASRLSFFLWSSLPDQELTDLAIEGKLGSNEVLLSQTGRMLRDARIGRMAEQFACQWFHIRDFDQNEEKTESMFPEFASLRGPMYQESVRFFADLFRNNGSILDILNADHTFLNEQLANHYGIPGIKGEEWQRVEGVQASGRGGILGMSTFLASQSGASRTSPILRGNWVYETLLGERLPRPPAGVPVLPEEVPPGLTERELIERHSSEPACAKCHVRIDPYGFALEQYDPTGKLRPAQINTKTKLPSGETIEGLNGLRDYLSTTRREDFVRHFCRKLLGYSLGRELQLSDEPLIEEMKNKLFENEFQFQIAVETIVTSPQFRYIRGKDQTDE